MRITIEVPDDVSMDDLISEVKTELRFRPGVYANLVERGKMTPAQKDKRIQFMERIGLILESARAESPHLFNSGAGAPGGDLDGVGPVIEAIIAERVNQVRKWGPQFHDPFAYMNIKAEEDGEAAKALNELIWGRGTVQDLKAELTQSAAVTVAIIQQLNQFETVKLLPEWRERHGNEPIPGDVAA